MSDVLAYEGVADALVAGEKYYLHFPAEALAKMRAGTLTKFLDAEGNWLCSLKDSRGHIRHLGRAFKCNPAFLTSLQMLAIRHALTEMSDRLDAAVGLLQQLLTGQASDRVAYVKAGISLFDQAMASNDEEHRNTILQSALSSLEIGRTQIIEFARRSLDTAPWYGKNGASRKEVSAAQFKEALENVVSPVQEGLPFCVLASQYIFRIHEMLGQNKAAHQSIVHLVHQLSDVVDVGRSLARHLPYKKESPPELFWTQIQQAAQFLEGKCGADVDVEIAFCEDQIAMNSGQMEAPR